LDSLSGLSGPANEEEEKKGEEGMQEEK